MPGQSAIRTLLGYASALLASGVRGQLTQAWAWDTFRSAQAAAGETVSGVSGSDMAQLIGWVNRSLTARENLAGAGPTQLIDATMITNYATYLLSPGSAASPKYAITANLTITGPTGPEQTPFWLEATPIGLTAGQMGQLVGEAADNWLNSSPTTYSGTISGVGTVTIFRI